MGSLDERKSNARFISILCSSVRDSARAGDGTPQQELERGLNEDEDAAVAAVHRNTVESAAGRSLGSKHRPSLEVSEEFEAALDGFTLPLVEHFAAAGAKQRLFNADSSGVGRRGGFAQSRAEGMSGAEAIGVRGAGAIVFVVQPRGFHEQKLILT